MTDTETQTPQKGYTYGILIVLLCVALGFIVLVCINAYRDASQKYLHEQNELLSRDAQDVLTRIRSWQDSLFYQTSILSTSSLYHLFAEDALARKQGRASNENALDPKDIVSAGMAAQAPLLRTMLQNFLEYSAFGQGRLVSLDGQELLAAMPDMPPLNEAQNTVVRNAIESGAIAFGSIHFVAGRLVQDFAVPLLPMLRSNETEPIMAALFFYAPLKGRIKHFLEGTKQSQNGSIQYIMQKDVPLYTLVQNNDLNTLDSDKQAIWTALTTEIVPFMRRPSLEGADMVFSTGMRIANPDWWIVTEIPAVVPADALKSIAWNIILLGIAAGFAFSLCLTLIWWLTIGRSQQQSKLRFKELYYTMRKQNILLNVNASSVDGMFMADMKGDILLCNQDFANIISTETRDELVGKKLYTLFRNEGSRRLLTEFTAVLHGGVATFEISLEKEDVVSLYRVTLCSFNVLEANSIQGAVGYLRDITEFRKNALASQKMQEGIIDALVRAIESVDPFLSGHSAMMQALGVRVAKHLELDDRDVKTIDLAAKLSQIGKLCLPKELWVKSESLTEAERQQLHQAPVFAYELLMGIHSELPIAEAVFALNEKMDGSGYPRGLHGDSISIHGRILAVLHAFCAMRSTRAWRGSMDTRQILDALRQSSAFDQVIVDALEFVLNMDSSLETGHHEK